MAQATGPVEASAERGLLTKLVEVGVAKRATSRSTSKRETIDTGKNKRFAKRTSTGRFKEMDNVSRSLSADRRRTATKTVKSGFGDQGDRKRPTTARRKKR
jgi:hypothetical protein